MKNVERASARADLPASPLPGLVALGGLITGGAGLLLTLFAVVVGQYSAAGLFLLATALVFGLLANAVFRS